MYTKSKALRHKKALIALLTILLNMPLNFAWAVENISLRAVAPTGVIVPNPMETSKLIRGKTYQVNHKTFSLQFFFNEKDIFGVILKRNKKHSIHFRWCLFKSCEESQYDYIKIIARASAPPFENDFFSIPYPSYLPYSFQGIEFSSPK
jgi:hypothetical protein